ncbi:TonB-dependent receptor domain-containing protein [Luteithermobacter gelatinilyticus]|uniref:TonB-dependent receptor domain-containing protein n=1 Tax=Luteithermobacter gelatinilyticus TaxID=2582913 RepID=UPI0011069D56|nr:TonB-dependent receptor [Luteithermobacter gelatinilyticus]
MPKTFFHINRYLKTGVSAFAVLGTLSVATTPFTAIAAEEEELTLEEVVVTGSRIKRKDLTAPSPVTLLDSNDVKVSGLNHVGELLNRLPSAGVPPVSDTNSNFTTTATGATILDLRDLGSERTLVLVNGRRHVGGLAGGPQVDVAMIPTAMIDRIEVVTGGASAVYGSEAIAGVVNLILKDDFEGVEFNSRFGISDEGDGEEYDLGATVGGTFGDDRGSAILHFSYNKKEMIESKDRDFSKSDTFLDDNQAFSSFPPQGHFFIPGQLRGFTLDPATGLFNKPFVSSEDGFNRNAFRLIRVPTERYLMSAKIDYDIADGHEFFIEGAYSRLQSDSRLEPTITGQFISVGNIPNINLPVDNPFIPAELLALIPDGTEEITFRKRFLELGPRTSDAQRQTFRVATGFKGDIDENWSYDTYYTFGVTTQDQINGGVFNSQNFLNGLNVEADPDNPGQFRCKDALARSQGCVPINVFGVGSISQEAIDYVSTPESFTSRLTQHVVAGSVTGNLLTLPAGDVGVALGAEYRKEKSEDNPDALAQLGITSGNSTPATNGEYDVKEFFSEVRVPVLADAAFAEYLGVEGAIRYADYSTVGGVWSYKLGGEWSPISDVRIRGGYSRAVRAPNIDELFNEGSETFRSVDDPCTKGGEGQPQIVKDRCATIPGVDENFDPGAAGIRSAGGFASGNPDLNEETADTWTIGAVVQPEAVPGLSLTVDYFNITVDDAINSFSAQTTAEQCLLQPDFPNNPFCELIQRDPVTGLILRIDAKEINVATFKTDGIDFSINYDVDADVLGLGEGDFNFNVIGTYMFSNNFTPFEGGEVIEEAGEVGLSKLKFNTRVTYNRDNFSISWGTRLIGSAVIDNTITTDDFAGNDVGAQWYHDLYASYNVLENVQLFGGVNNVFDKTPPAVPAPFDQNVTGTVTAADVYDAVGRYFYFGVTSRF